jgi:flagellar protein FlgJ
MRTAGLSAQANKKGDSAFARLLASDPAQDKKLKESCQQLEGLLVKQMLTVMRKSVDKSGFIDGGHAEEIFSDMLYDHYADSMSQNGNFGLSKTIYSQLSGGKKWA